MSDRRHTVTIRRGSSGRCYGWSFPFSLAGSEMRLTIKRPDGWAPWPTKSSADGRGLTVVHELIGTPPEESWTVYLDLTAAESRLISLGRLLAYELERRVPGGEQRVYVRGWIEGTGGLNDDLPLFDPMQLAALGIIRHWWTADDIATAGPTAWLDRVGGFSLAAVGGPAWSATGLNGKPAVAFDGNDCFEANGVGNLPVGSATSNVIIVCDQARPGSETGVSTAFGYGSAAASAGRMVSRTPASGMNRLRIHDGATNLTGTVSDFSGAHIVQGLWTSTAEFGFFDGGATTPPSAAITPNTATTRTRIGAQLGGSPGNFWSGKIRHIFATGDLLTQQRDALTGWCAWDSDLVANLPANHPHKLDPPWALV